MVVNYFYLSCVPFLPKEADTPLIVYSNAMLPLPDPMQLLQSISWRHSQAIQRNSCIQNLKLHSCCSVDTVKLSYIDVIEKLLSVPASK
jgi:hypothetical protein